MIQRSEILDHWRMRATSLHDLINDLILVLNQQLPTTITDDFAETQRRTIPGLLAALRDFADQQFAFFLDVFAAQPANSTTDYVFDVSLLDIEYILRETAEQVGSDIELFTRAFNQRDATSPLREALIKADKLAALALKPAVEHGLVPPHGCLTYFTKSVRSRIIPYADMAIVGIPLTAIDVPRDLLGIAHEIGHVVYCHPKEFKDWAVDAEEPQPARKWFEEIFADVYSCIVAGPAAAVTLTELCASKMSKAEYRDDGIHPPAPIRPKLQVDTLRRMADAGGATMSVLQTKLAAAATELEQQWSDWQVPSAQLTALFDDPFSPAQGSLTQEEDTPEDLAQEIWGYLESLNSNTAPWSKEIGVDTQFSALISETLTMAGTTPTFANIPSQVRYNFIPQRDDILASLQHIQSMQSTTLQNHVKSVFEAGGWGFSGGGPPRVSKG